MTSLKSRLRAAEGVEGDSDRLQLADDLACHLFPEATLSDADTCLKVLQGSVDAALALPREVLPGWEFTLRLWADGTADVEADNGADLLKGGSLAVPDVIRQSAPIALFLEALERSDAPKVQIDFSLSLCYTVTAEQSACCLTIKELNHEH